jgi:hypothetical protein
VKRRRRGWSPDNHAYQHRSPDPTKIERATATSTVALFFYFVSVVSVVAVHFCLNQRSTLNQFPNNHFCLIAGWINNVVESNKPAADFCLSQLSTRNKLDVFVLTLTNIHPSSLLGDQLSISHILTKHNECFLIVLSSTQVNRFSLITAWINCVVESRKPAVDICLNQWSTRNQSFLVDYCLNQLSSRINQNSSDFRLNQWSNRNQRFWLIQLHWINSPDFSDVHRYTCLRGI